LAWRKNFPTCQTINTHYADSGGLEGVKEETLRWARKL
jgi:hypothetical protein